MKPLAFVHNDAAPYRHGLFKLLAEEEGAEFLLYQGRSVSGRDVASQIASLDVPVRTVSQREVFGAVGSGAYRAVISSTNGRLGLPAAYFGARRARVPFLLWASMWRHPQTALHRAGWPLVRRIYRAADAVVTYGPHVSRLVAEVRGGAERIFEAPQATDNERWSAEPDPALVAAIRERAPGPFVLFVGRMEEGKGIPTLIDAWGRLVSTGASEDARLVALGSGPLEGLFSGLPSTELVPWVHYDELPAWYSAATLTVVPSVPTRAFMEPWGFVCNESLLRATPVVASDTVGAVAGGLITDGETGLVVPTSDVEALASGIRTLLTDPQLGSELGVRGRDRVRAEYTHSAQLRGFQAALAATGVRQSE